MKSSSLELRLGNLETEALKFAAPAEVATHQKRREFRDVFLARTRETKPYQNGQIFSGYATNVAARSGLSAAKTKAKELQQAGFDTMLVLGIGGSSLGAKCAYEALKLHQPLRRLIFLENIDPLAFHAALSSVDLKKTAVALITKAGGTIETLAQFSQVLKSLKNAVGNDWKKHLVAITDPSKGELRAWVKAEGLSALEVPPEVGGRFSVFTPVGTLPLAFAGLNVDAFIDGAQSLFAGKVLPLEKLEDLALRLMDLHIQGSDTHVIMPYASSLKSLGEWSVQLIGESLGKPRNAQSRVGIVPLAALGATDQHSLLQLLMEGPTKFVTHFVRVKAWPKLSADYQFDTLPESFTSLRFAYGKDFAEILNLELSATAAALAQGGRANFEIALRDLSEESIGALLAFYMDLTSLLGVYLEIDPYNQPGVELGKQILKTLV